MAIRFDEIGRRLKAYRMGRSLLAEQIAEKPRSFASRRLSH